MANGQSGGGTIPGGPSSGVSSGGGGGGTITVSATPGLFGDGSPGNILNQHVADSSHNGYMTLNQAAQLQSVFNAKAWEANRFARMQVLIPSLNRWKLLPPGGTEPNGGYAIANIFETQSFSEGIAWNLPQGVECLLSQGAFKAQKTGKFAIAFEMQSANIVGGRHIQFGIAGKVAGGSPPPSLDTYVLATQLVSNGHWFLETDGTLGATQQIDSGVANDPNHVYQVILFGDGTTIGLDMDGVTVATTTNLTNMANALCMPYVNLTAFGDFQLLNCGIGYAGANP